MQVLGTSVPTRGNIKGLAEKELQSEVLSDIKIDIVTPSEALVIYDYYYCSYIPVNFYSNAKMRNCVMHCVFERYLANSISPVERRWMVKIKKLPLKSCY